MTNTQLMELLHNNTINHQTKKALYIAIGVIAVGGIAFYYYQKNQGSKYGALNKKHLNFVNSADARINGLAQIVTKKDNKIVEQMSIIKQQQDEHLIFKNKINAQLAKDVKPL